MRNWKRHLNPATVISCVALFVALGGAAYAVSPIGKKSVKTQHLGNGAVTTLKLRNGAVTTAKLRNLAVTSPKLGEASVTSGKLANGAVRSAALGGGVVTTGKLKDGAVSESKLEANAVSTGKLQSGAVTSAKLATSFLGQLVKNVSYVTKATETDATTPKSVTAECPVGKQAIGGGIRTSRGSATVVQATESVPFLSGDGKRTGWTAAALGDGTFAVEAHAICAEF